MGLKVIVLDDEESIRETFKLHLEEQGHIVETSDRPSSCAAYQEHDCERDFPCGHVFFIDYFLPEMNGLKFIELMEGKGCKVATRNKILMSGDTTAINPKKAQQLGCMVMQKPLTLEKLDNIMLILQSALTSDEVIAELAG